jgi:hypothetical protein
MLHKEAHIPTLSLNNSLPIEKIKIHKKELTNAFKIITGKKTSPKIIKDIEMIRGKAGPTSEAS